MIGAAAVAAGLALLGQLAGQAGVVLTAVGLALFLFTCWFFRDPRREPPPEAAEGNLLLAPADGKVVEIVEEYEPLYLQGPARRLSIFLSPLDVHINRSPVDGVVEYVQYFPGEYLVAWHPKASEKNERSAIGVRHPKGTPVLFKQIAGVLARRIVFYSKLGDRYRAGERFGLVKFGSRMDVLVPPHIQFDVELGDRVVAGVTVIGRIESERAAVPDDPATRQSLLLEN